MTMQPPPDLLDLAEAVAAGTLRADDAEWQLRAGLGPQGDHGSDRAVRELHDITRAVGAVRSHVSATREATAAASPDLAHANGSIMTIVPGPVRPAGVRRRSSRGSDTRRPRRTWLLVAATLLIGAGVVGASVVGGRPVTRTTAPTPPVAVAYPSATPEVLVPSSAWTAEEVAQRALADIALTERLLGRVLAPARILRVVLLPPGAEYHVRQLDGNEYLPSGWTEDGSSWTVEAVGTFANFGVPGADGPVSEAGTHGYFSYVDSGGVSVGDAGGSRGFFPCWFRSPQPADTEGLIPMEGTCNPTSGEPAPTVAPTPP